MAVRNRYWPAFCLVSIACFSTGCDPETFSRGQVPAGNVSPTSAQAPDYIIVGSFNIKQFGPSKRQNPTVMKSLASIVRRFDLMAIQEVTDVEEKVIPEFLRELNSDGSKFSHVIGPRQGWGNQKEQYVFIYDSQKLELVAAPFVAADPTGQLDRPPLFAHFRCKNLPVDQAFSFGLLNIHTVPDEYRTELSSLVPIIDGVRRTLNGAEDDLILIGDLNAPPKALESYPWFENQLPIIHPDWPTNTLGDQSYDNIVFDALRTAEFQNQSGVFNMMQELGISLEESQKLSDHMPVWGVFSTRETPAASLTQRPDGSLR